MAHHTTKSAIEALAEQEQTFWEEGKQYFYPYRQPGSLGETDWYNTHTANVVPEHFRQVLPYAYEILGKSFHNFPVEQEISRNDGSWQTNTEKCWRWIMQGFDYYLSSTVRSLKEDRLKDACGFLGWLCHVLQDQAGFLHALQGPAGIEPISFNQFFPPPPDRPYRNPLSYLREGCPLVEIKGYKPMLLGTSIPEAAFHLYHRYRQAERHSRRQLIPLIQSGYAGDKAQGAQGAEIRRSIAIGFPPYTRMMTATVAEIRRSIAIRIAEVLADLFHTVYCLAREEFPDQEASSLERVDMVELFPIEYPSRCREPYNWTPMVKGYSLEAMDTVVPLMLMLEENGKKRKVTFKTGLGTGTYFEYVLSYGIPRDVYQRVELAVGLHADIGERGQIAVDIKLDEDTLFRREFKGSSEAARLAIDVSRGGIVRLIVRNLTPYDWSGNHVVWGEPFLLK